jgi:hypothetical protein
LPSDVSHNIVVRHSKRWPLLPAEDPGPEEDLYDGLELHPPWTWDFLDPVPRGGGDGQVYRQNLKPGGGDRSFSPKGLHLVSISVHFLSLCVTQGRVLHVGLVFYVDIMVLLLLLLISR